MEKIYHKDTKSTKMHKDNNFPLALCDKGKIFSSVILCVLCVFVVSLLTLGCAASTPPEPGLLKDAVDLNDAGYHYYRQGKWNLAEQKFAQALKMNRLIDRREGIAANLNNLGVLALEKGDLGKAGQ